MNLTASEICDFVKLKSPGYSEAQKLVARRYEEGNGKIIAVEDVDRHG